ncbi:MAG: hypothetical protein WCW67_06425 [Candidatus Margulisiibacteriota bacterium]|jgi:hypothetical protein
MKVYCGTHFRSGEIIKSYINAQRTCQQKVRSGWQANFAGIICLDANRGLIQFSATTGTDIDIPSHKIGIPIWTHSEIARHSLNDWGRLPLKFAPGLPPHHPVRSIRVMSFSPIPDVSLTFINTAPEAGFLFSWEEQVSGGPRSLPFGEFFREDNLLRYGDRANVLAKLGEGKSYSEKCDFFVFPTDPASDAIHVHATNYVRLDGDFRRFALEVISK